MYLEKIGSCVYMFVKKAPENQQSSAEVEYKTREKIEYLRKLSTSMAISLEFST